VPEPRNPRESLHAHDIHLAYPPVLLKATQKRLRSQAQYQSIAKAMVINPKMPSAMIVFVVLSIVTSGRPAEA
jgi:hypothetical protein